MANDYNWPWGLDNNDFSWKIQKPFYVAEGIRYSETRRVSENNPWKDETRYATVDNTGTIVSASYWYDDDAGFFGRIPILLTDIEDQEKWIWAYALISNEDDGAGLGTKTF